MRCLSGQLRGFHSNLIMNAVLRHFFAKLRKSSSQLRHVCLSVYLSVRPSVSPHRTRDPTRSNFMKFMYFSKISPQNSSFFEIYYECRAWALFATLWKTTLSFRHVCLSVYLSARPFVHEDRTRLPLEEISWSLCIFRKSVHKIQVSLKYNQNYGYFTWRPIYIYIYLW